MDGVSGGVDGGILQGFAGKPSDRLGGGLGHRRSLAQVVSAPDAAGVCTSRITELSLHTRKRTDHLHRNSRDSIPLTWIERTATAAAEETTTPPSSNTEKNTLNTPEIKTEIYKDKYNSRKKCNQIRQCGLNPQEQRLHFQTRWKPVKGKMEFCTARKEGSAAVECNIDLIDRENTYHTWKKMNQGQRHTNSHLQFDRFLTVEDSAKRYDRLPLVVNRGPPSAEKEGPFEYPRKHGGNLNRMYIPRPDALTNDQQQQHKLLTAAAAAAKNSHLHTSTLLNITGADRGELKSGVKRQPCPDHAFDFLLPSSS